MKDDNYFMDAFLAIFTTPTKIQKFTRRTPPPRPPPRSPENVFIKAV